MKKFWVIMWYCCFQFFPNSTFPLVGRISEKMRGWCCKHIFKSCGNNVNVGRRTHFGWGENIVIGYNSGIGINAVIPSNIMIGEHVMMGPDVTIYGSNHAYDRIDIPMTKQGMKKYPPVVIEDDVWIGGHVIINAGRRIRKGTIVAAGSVVTKDFPEYSIIGGNPAKLIKSRNEQNLIL